MRRILGVQLTSASADAGFGQILFFVIAPIFLVGSLHGIALATPTRAEAILGILGSLSVTLLFVIVGLLLPLTTRPR